MMSYLLSEAGISAHPAGAGRASKALNKGCCSCIRLDMSSISLKINGQSHAVDVDSKTPFFFVLADEIGLRGPKVWMRHGAMRVLH